MSLLRRSSGRTQPRCASNKCLSFRSMARADPFALLSDSAVPGQAASAGRFLRSRLSPAALPCHCTPNHHRIPVGQLQFEWHVAAYGFQASLTAAIIPFAICCASADGFVSSRSLPDHLLTCVLFTEDMLAFKPSSTRLPMRVCIAHAVVTYTTPHDRSPSTSKFNSSV